MWGNWNSHTLPGGMYNGAAAVENSLEVSQKVKPRTADDPAIIPKEMTMCTRNLVGKCSERRYL